MAAEINPAASHHLPFFITAPGETDVLFNVMTIVVLLAIVLIGVFYFRIHALPEHMASRMTKIQYELVAVLALISLFTHNHAFWIAGLLLAFVPIPDFSTPLSGMAKSLNRIADAKAPATPEPAAIPAVPQTAPEIMMAEKPREAGNA
jgi:hypothetical protein